MSKQVWVHLLENLLLEGVIFREEIIDLEGCHDCSYIVDDLFLLLEVEVSCQLFKLDQDVILIEWVGSSGLNS